MPDIGKATRCHIFLHPNNNSPFPPDSSRCDAPPYNPGGRLARRLTGDLQTAALRKTARESERKRFIRGKKIYR